MVPAWWRGVPGVYGGYMWVHMVGIWVHIWVHIGQVTDTVTDTVIDNSDNSGQDQAVGRPKYDNSGQDV